MDFWDAHSFMFIVGFLLCPGLVLVYFGFIPPLQVPPLMGLIFVPRLFMTGILSNMYWDTNPVLIVICWILAVIFDLVGIFVKIGIIGTMMQVQLASLASNR